MTKLRAPRNRTLQLTDVDRKRLQTRIHTVIPAAPPTAAICRGDSFQLAGQASRGSVDLLILDPPYNRAKRFRGAKFSRLPVDEYAGYIERMLVAWLPALKSTASIYLCGDWHSSVSIYAAAAKYLQIRNRITWEREKGRGARGNWKNASEDIWFCTVSDTYHFDADAVKVRRKVMAPYTQNGAPKDWDASAAGRFRDTHPSNLWNDITIPFWSMPENTEHPTQKSEKWAAKLILASSRPGDLIVDPFMGSGSVPVTAIKLGRRALGIEMEHEYCLLALRRLELAAQDAKIQGISGGVFWERNTLALQQREEK